MRTARTIRIRRAAEVNLGARHTGRATSVSSSPLLAWRP
jgi:hypothetical protein